ncbi:hypothetical protein SAY86_020446 [Trapa natans]|uniref:VQ domain-containing protein n=1 Tax=Trapa natans TaxID=22666 RepID=A0AAN7LZD0_TRANT|nr:hypothetical protein SAY86_020446 [Trapa natans]
MSPAKSHVHPSASTVHINGARPLPLKISNGSHLIQKSCPRSSYKISFSSSSSSYQLTGHASVTTLPENNNNQRQKKQPVIIYLESPKVIHTRASDFMAIVQKLTGYLRLDDEKGSSADLGKIKGDDHQSDLHLRLSPRVISQIPEPPNLHQLRDIPLLTPSSMNLFLSPHSRSFMVPDAGGDFMSPSGRRVEFMNNLSEF